MNTDIQETANIKSGPSSEKNLYYYKELWTNNFLQKLLEYRKCLRQNYNNGRIERSTKNKKLSITWRR
jgi:hypothetical protein